MNLTILVTYELHRISENESYPWVD